MAAVLLERRHLLASVLEARDEGSSGPVLTGYASVFDTPYQVSWFTETVAPGAFKRSLGAGPDVRLLVNHDGLPLARTASGTLKLSEDSTGLLVEARLDPSDPDVQALLPKVRRGDLSQMSFGFRVPAGGDEWNEDGTQRTLRNVDLNHGDVSAVTYPASPTTSFAIRGLGTGTAEAIASAVAAFETRGAEPREVAEFLGRVQRAMHQTGSGSPAPEDIVAMSDEARRAKAERQARKRAMRILGL